MNSVEPIRNYKLLMEICDYLEEKNMRNYVLFSMGIYIPIRISDLLKLKVRDVRGRKQICIREMKTGKEQLLAINTKLQIILKRYTDEMEDYEYLFVSRKEGKHGPRPISRQQAYTILNDVAKEFGLYNIGCHTMRKTFGYHYYQQTHDIARLMGILNHHDISVTKRYIGLTQEMKDDALATFEYKDLGKNTNF